MEAWFHKLSDSKYGFQQSPLDHSLFNKKNMSCVVILVYIDDIVITGDNDQGILATKAFLQKHLVTNNIGSLRYFVHIEVSRSDKRVTLSQCK